MSLPSGISPALQRSRFAIVAIFFVNGIMGASLSSRLVIVRESIHVTPGQMGGLLLLISVGSLVIMPATGTIVSKCGAKPVMALADTLAGASLVAVGVFAARHQPAGVGVMLTLYGVGFGSCDVAMNLAGAGVERRIGRSIMPQYHAGYSLGTVASAGVGALIAWLGIPLMAHFGLVVVFGLLVMFAGLFFVPKQVVPIQRGLAADTRATTAHSPAAAPSRNRRRRGSGAMAAWLEPRTIFIGLVMLSVSLAEGSGGDWITSGVVQGFQTSESFSIVVLGLFLTAITVTRVFGTGLIDRWGRVQVLHWCAACAAAGLLLFGLSPWLPLVLIGVVLWGVGAALGFPIGVSAANDDPAKAAQRASVVTTIGYFAFLGGPPLIGLLAGAVGFRRAILVVIVPTAAAFVLARFTAPIRITRNDGSVGLDE